MLKWRDNPAGLEDHLKKFMRVEGEEIVKVIKRIRMGEFGKGVILLFFGKKKFVYKRLRSSFYVSQGY